MEVTTSYSQKLNHELYGGNKFESTDYFCALKIEVAGDSDVKEITDDLRRQCKEAVDRAIDEQIMKFQGGIPASEFTQYMQDYVANRKIDGERYYDMSRYQQDLIQTIKRGKATLKRDVSKKE